MTPPLRLSPKPLRPAAVVPSDATACKVLCYPSRMASIVQFMPKPLGAAVELAKPFVLIPVGLALYLALLYMVTGQDPSIPAGRFLMESVEALGPFAGFLTVLWLYYVVAYVAAGAYAHDLWPFARVPDWLVGFLRRHCFFSQQESTLPVHLISPFSPVRLYRPHPPGLRVMGWWAGDSAQLE